MFWSRRLSAGTRGRRARNEHASPTRRFARRIFASGNEKRANRSRLRRASTRRSYASASSATPSPRRRAGHSARRGSPPSQATQVSTAPEVALFENRCFRARRVALKSEEALADERSPEIASDATKRLPQHRRGRVRRRRHHHRRGAHGQTFRSLSGRYVGRRLSSSSAPCRGATIRSGRRDARGRRDRNPRIHHAHSEQALHALG